MEIIFFISLICFILFAVIIAFTHIIDCLGYNDISIIRDRIYLVACSYMIIFLGFWMIYAIILKIFSLR